MLQSFSTITIVMKISEITTKQPPFFCVSNHTRGQPQNTHRVSLFLLRQGFTT